MKSIYLFGCVAFCLLAGCSFKSNLKIETQVYGGPTERLDVEPDAFEIIRSVEGTKEAAYGLKQSSTATASRLESLAQAGQIYVTEAERVIKELGGTPEYETAARNYFSGISNLVHVLVLLQKQGDTNDVKLQTDITAALQNQRTRFRTEGNTPSLLISAKGVPVELYVNDAIRNELKGRQDADRAFLTIYRALLGRQANTRNESLNDLVLVIRRGNTNALPVLETELMRMGAALEAEAFQPKAMNNPLETAVRRSTVIAVDLNRRWDEKEKGELQVKLAQVELTARDLMTAALDAAAAGGERDATQQPDGKNLKGAEGDKSRNKPRIDLLLPTAKFQRALISYANAVSNAVATLDVNEMRSDWVTTLTVDLPQSQLGAVAKAFDKQAKDRIAAVVAGDGDAPMHNILLRLLEQLNTAVVAASRNLSLLNSRSPNAVAAVRGQPFQFTDPNIKTITKVASQTNWNIIPISGLEALGDGNAQYVIVQDSLTTFRVKELSVDPSGVINLQMDVGEMAVDLLGKVATAAAAAYGLPVGKIAGADKAEADSGTGGNSQPLSARTADEIVGREVREMLNRLGSRLRVQLRELEDRTGQESNPFAASRLRGVMKSYEEQLGVIVRKINEAAPVPATPAPAKEE